LQPLLAKLQRPGALLMQLSRMVELWLAAEAGAANVRQWLMVSTPTCAEICCCLVQPNVTLCSPKKTMCRNEFSYHQQHHILAAAPAS
jgi:hypothetical protein